MISIPIWLFLILLLIAGFTIIVFVGVLIGYITYCKECDKKKREVIEKQYGKRNKN